MMPSRNLLHTAYICKYVVRNCQLLKYIGGGAGMFKKGDRVVTRDGVGVVTSSRLNEFNLEVDVDGCGLGYYDPKECTAYNAESQLSTSHNTQSMQA